MMRASARECFESVRCANLRVLSRLARARAADNNWPSSGGGAGVTTRSGGSIYITIFYAQAVVVIDTYSKTLNDNADSACCWIDIFDSFLLSTGAKRGLPRERRRLKNSLHFSEKWLRFQQPRGATSFWCATHSLCRRRKKFENARERRHAARRCVALKGKWGKLNVKEFTNMRQN